MDFEKSIAYMKILDLELGKLYIQADYNSLMKLLIIIWYGIKEDGLNKGWNAIGEETCAIQNKIIPYLLGDNEMKKI